LDLAVDLGTLQLQYCFGDYSEKTFKEIELSFYPFPSLFSLFTPDNSGNLARLFIFLWTSFWTKTRRKLGRKFKMDGRGFVEKN